MFENITNQDLKKALKRLKSYVDCRVIVLAILFAIAILAGLFSVNHPEYEQIDYSQEISQINTAIENLQLQIGNEESLEQDQVPSIPSEVIDNEQTDVTVNVELSYKDYNEMWEYLEYGNTVEYFHPEGTMVNFYFHYGENRYYKQMELEPPQFRALMAKFPEYVTYLSKGYQVNATIQGEEVISINWIENSVGQRVWDPSMEKTSRELNALEKWSLMYAEAKGYEFLIEDWFDTLPECRDQNDWGGSECRYVDWSPAEEYARAIAFYNFATDPEKNVWVQVWGAVDARYRWVDAETGELLNIVDPGADLWELPESGWMALQIGVIGDNGTYAEPERWETTYKIKMSPGFVVGIDQAGYIFQTGPLGWNMLKANYVAYRTQEWVFEMMVGLLPTEITE